MLTVYLQNYDSVFQRGQMKTCKISVLVPEDEAHHFENYCREHGFKKSTLIVRLIKEHLNQNAPRTSGPSRVSEAERHH
jgi:hypothetical protein